MNNLDKIQEYIEKIKIKRLELRASRAENNTELETQTLLELKGLINFLEIISFGAKELI